ncbi:MAG: hypothetical protein ABIT20_10295 [Gemmatimonadaceae bacterium]
MLAVVGGSGAASAQRGFPRDTINPHYARLRDELPEMLHAMSPVVEHGLDDATLASIVAELRARMPQQRPGRFSYPGSRTYVITAGFRGREMPLSLRFNWPDTNVVSFRVQSPDISLAIAIDSAILESRSSRLVKPRTLRMSVADLEGFNGREQGITLSMSVPNAPHCPGYGGDWRLRKHGDTLSIYVAGVPPAGYCPTPTGLRGSSYWFPYGPGHHTILVDLRGDTNVIALNVTDSSLALVPVHTTIVDADQTVQWRVPSASISLTCHRQSGDPRLCDALHEFVLSQPGVRVQQYPAAGVAAIPPHFPQQRVALYHYSTEETAAKVRRCVASIPPQTRLNSWVRVLGRPTTGRWWGESPTGTSDSRAQAPAEGLDATGNLPSTCGDIGPVTLASAPITSAVAPHVVRTFVAQFAPERTEATIIEARSDGWVMLTPPASAWRSQAQPTTHLFARAADAQRWVTRVRDVLSLRSMNSDDGESSVFIPALGRGTVRLTTRVTDSLGYPKVWVALEDCAGLSRGYNVDGQSLLMIAWDIERAAELALRSSSVPTPPTLARAYEADDVSCRAVAQNATTRLPFPEALPAAKRQAADVVVRFIVDTMGRVEPQSISLFDRTPTAIAAASRAHVATWRFRPAELAGVRVRQFINVKLAFDSTTAPP